MVYIKRTTARQIARMASVTHMELHVSPYMAYKAMRGAPKELQIKAAYKSTLMDDGTVLEHMIMPSNNMVGNLSMYIFETYPING